LRASRAIVSSFHDFASFQNCPAPSKAMKVPSARQRNVHREFGIRPNHINRDFAARARGRFFVVRMPKPAVRSALTSSSFNFETRMIFSYLVGDCPCHRRLHEPRLIGGGGH
jgi:hypothetical protein